MPAPTEPARIKEVNESYHDAAAATYDSKWGIDFGEIGQDQVTGKIRKAFGEIPPKPFESALEIGSGTGYFSLNLIQAGVVEKVTATDISPGMLETLSENARRLGVAVETKVTEAETLPFADESFDLVFGHAILHHIPDLGKAFAEFFRVLKPGGAMVFCGEPSRYGDRLAVLPKRGATLAAPLWRRAMRASPNSKKEEACDERHELESEVDVHAFAPAALDGFATGAGFDQVHVRGEELLANVHGWTMRTLEGSAEPEEVPMAWRKFAFRSYIALQKVDTIALEPYLPASLFYNLLISGRKPEST